MSYLERIRRLRDRAVSPKICYHEFWLNFYRVYDGNNYGDAFYHAMDALTPVIEDDELIVGRTVPCLSREDAAEWETRVKPIAQQHAWHAGGGQDSHMAVDYDLLLHEGIDGILARIAAYREKNGASEFYDTCEKCLEGVKVLAAHYSEKAAAMAAECTDAARKAELLRISEVCARVPAKPAQSFHEAVQSVNLVTHCLSMNPFRLCHQQFQLGHPDRYLYPFFRADMDAGVIDADRAQELFDCLAIHINTRVPNGLSSGYMLAGRDADGKVVANELTMMGMQAIDDLHLVYPSVGLCMTSETPEEYLIKACEVLSHGCSHPAIFNDDVITAGLRHYGVTEAESHEYIHSTCVEITPVAASNVWVASPYTNLPQILLSAMDREYESFDALTEEIFARLRDSIRVNFEAENARRRQRAENSCNPLLSCFVNDCLALGLDIEQGGARYNWIMPSFVGMGNLVDALYAVKTLVFERKALTLAEYKAACDANFEGYEALRNEIANRIPKYGNDNDDVDTMFDKLTRFIVEECETYPPMHQNGRLIPSVFCWIMHERFGSQTGATPDGRLAGFPLGDGSGPCQGR
ncbi:MAG: hypothetical protein J6C52_14500, partial [Clostridia bacterium]|nr:hypothetical protein [Clostridia bacterium]